MIDRLTKVSELIKDLDSKLGVKKLMLYTAYFFLVSSFANWKDTMINFENLFSVRHSERLQVRSRAEYDISNHLKNLRSILNADRVLLFEYHNTISGLSGVPFRFMSLTQIEYGYGIPQIDTDRYQSINTGIIKEFTSYLERYQYLCCEDYSKFKRTYPTTSKIFESDNIRCLAIEHLRGSSNQLGFIVVEWTNESTYLPNWDAVRTELSKAALRIVSSLTIREE